MLSPSSGTQNGGEMEMEMEGNADLAARVARLEEEVGQWRDRAAIEAVLTRYSRAMDWFDAEMLDGVFYDDARIDYGFSEAKTAQGHIGIKVWVNQGDYLKTEGGTDAHDAQAGQVPKKPKRPRKR